MSSRLTEQDEQGNWGVKGLPWKDLYEGNLITKEIREKLYGCLAKLKDYENTGLSPQQAEELMDEDVPNINVGSKKRLIDAEEFKKQVAGMCIKNNGSTDAAIPLIKWIDSQPTAYDVDKVIGQLEEKVFELPIGGMAVSCLGRSVAIEIVRTGGDTVGETHTGTIHGSAGGRTGSEPPDPAGRRPAGEDGRKGLCGV